MITEEVYLDEDDEIIQPNEEEILNRYKEKYKIIQNQINKWEWQMFGTSQLVFALPFEVSWWKRLCCKFFFGSKWKRIGE